MYLSARLPAETVSLAAIAAWLGGKRTLATALVLVAGLLHPLMALPAAILLFAILVEEKLGPKGLAFLFAALITGGWAATLLLSGSSDESTAQWMLTLRTRSLFLFPVDWKLQDWQHDALVLATISLAYVSARTKALAGLSSSMVVLGLAGIGLSVIAGAMLDHEALLKVQPWRWFWPVVVGALILLPGTIEELWREETLSARRTCAILLVAAWLTMDTYGGFIALAALVVFASRRRLPDSALRALRTGSWLVMAAAIGSVSAVIWQCAMYPLDTNMEPLWMQRLVNAIPTNSAAVAVIFLAWVLTRIAARSRTLVAICAVCAAMLLVALLPRAYRTWTTERFPPSTHAAFAQWRAVIPEKAEVLWPNNPTGVWVLLERRSYMSEDQLAGLLYSPQMTQEFHRRAEALRPLVTPGWWTLASRSDSAAPRKLTPSILEQICKAPGLDYVVDRSGIEGYVAMTTIPIDSIRVYLYDCHRVGLGGDAT
jgi:hypothetical protein